ncbi:UBX domain-containing protein 4 [Cephus cinctus]|uniref:UBX domain-containing protein 4 n=1 Tax=Cephus cinctus TaxID=211228 RepID=A0AAJ7BX65_CEPCN|nr:UBX domain-containing protein 4 [Cephus cinctus]
MKWFEGSINEAVATSKFRKAIFVVFVEGKDDTSVQVANAISADEVSSRLQQDDFVAIRLESGSDTYRFFAQIYQLVPVPSLFFIGENGSPLEIVAGNTTASELLIKIDGVLAKVGKGTKNSSTNLIQVEQKIASATNATKTPDTNASSSSETETLQEQVNPESKTESNSNSPTPNESIPPETTGSTEKVQEPTTSTSETAIKDAALSAEERVERARQLIELQKKQREEEEKRKERERELERRRMGRDVQKMRQKQQDLEIKQAHEERMREKAAETAAREKVKQQIAQDKLERKHKELALQQQVAQQQQNQEQPKPRTVIPSDASIARIQFRLPTGKPHMGQFEASSTLGALRTYVVQNIELPFTHFAMSTTFPRRDLINQDDNKTLLELELVPTAVILILPLRNANITSAITTTQDVGFFSRFMWGIFAPIISIYNYVLGYFSGRPRRNPERQNNTPSTSGTTTNIDRSPTTQPQSSGLTRRNIDSQGTTTIRAQGNIHRLHSGGDDNDENNTWNGNSTQQM